MGHALPCWSLELLYGMFPSGSQKKDHKTHCCWGLIQCRSLAFQGQQAGAEIEQSPQVRKFLWLPSPVSTFMCTSDSAQLFVPQRRKPQLLPC